MRTLRVLYNHIFRRKKMQTLMDEINLHAEVNPGGGVDYKVDAMLKSPTMGPFWTELARLWAEMGGMNVLELSGLDKERMQRFTIMIRPWHRPEPSTIISILRRALNEIYLLKLGDHRVDQCIRSAYSLLNYPLPHDEQEDAEIETDGV